MRMTLHVVSRNAEPFDLHVDLSSYTIGRSSSADLVIRDPSISRQHARLFIRNDQLYVEDLNSHNGTWLNGSQVSEAQILKLGDEVELARDLERETCALRLELRPFEGGHRVTQVGVDTQETVIKSVRELFESQTGADLSDLEEADELRDYAERLRILNEVHHAVGSTKDIQHLLELILDRVFRFLEPEAAFVFLADESGALHLAAQRSASGERTRPVLSETLVRQIAEDGNALLVHDALHDRRFATATSLHVERIRSLVASPLVDGQGSIGLILLYSRDIFGKFSERDLELLVSLATVATLRLRNLRLEEQARGRLQRMVEEKTQELNARKEELETLDTIVRVINMEHSRERVLQSVLEQGSVLFPQAERGLFLLRDPRDGNFHLQARMGYGEELDALTLTPEQVAEAFTTRELGVDSGMFWASPQAARSLEALGAPVPGALLVMTFVLENVLEGFAVFDTGRSQAFHDGEAQRLARFRDHAASAVAKACLVHSLRQKTEEIARTQNQLLIREKMASLGHLTAGVSHEINNPNNFIFAGAQNLEVFLREFRQYLITLAGDDLEPNLRQEFDNWFSRLFEQVETIIVGSKRINTIVADLQLVSRFDEAQRKQMDLLQSLSASVNLMEPSFYYVDFCCDFRGPLIIDCFPAELNQVFMNIIVNACEAMTPRPLVRLPAHHGLLRILAKREGECALIRFEDNGPGIDPKDLGRIFEAFFTTKPPGSNTGLGLYTCYKIIEKHQGQIDVQSVLGKGTTVTVKLPLDLTQC